MAIRRVGADCMVKTGHLDSGEPVVVLAFRHHDSGDVFYLTMPTSTAEHLGLELTWAAQIGVAD